MRGIGESNDFGMVSIGSNNGLTLGRPGDQVAVKHDNLSFIRMPRAFVRILSIHVLQKAEEFVDKGRAAVESNTEVECSDM